MKKNKYDGYWTTLPLLIFHVGILVIICREKDTFFEILADAYKDIGMEENLEEDTKALKELFEEDGDYLSDCTNMLDNPTRDIIMAFNAESPAAIEIPTIVHEFHHAAAFVCKRVGIEDEEAEAYTQEYLYNMFMSQISEWNKAHSKRKSSKKTK